MKEACEYCKKPVQDHEAAHGATGNHWECQQTAKEEFRKAKDTLDMLNHVTTWYQLLGSSEDEAKRRVAQERKLIQRRYTK